MEKYFEGSFTSHSTYKKILCMILFLYLIMAGLMVFFVHQYFGEIDGTEMVFGAQSIFSGLGYKGIPRDYWPPLYSLLLIPFFLLTGNWFIAGKVISLISSIIFLYFSYNSIELLFNENIALITIVLIILNPFFVLFSTLVEDHMLFSSLSIIGLYYFIKFSKNDLPSKYSDFLSLVTAGCFISLASLTRYPGYVFFLIIIIYLIFGNLFPNSDINLSLTRRLQIVLIFSSIFFLVQSPWIIINLIEKHAILYQTNYLDFAVYYYHFSPDFWWTSAVQYHSFLDVLLKQSIIAHINHISYTLSTLLNLVITDIYGPELLILPILPIIFKKFSNSLSIVICICGFYMTTYLLAFVVIEYLIPIFPFLYCLIASIVDYILNKSLPILNICTFKINKKKSLINIFVLLFMFLLLIIPSIIAENNSFTAVSNFDTGTRNWTDYSYIANAIIPYKTANDCLMSIVPNYSFYAHLCYLTLPYLYGVSIKDILLYKNMSAYAIQRNLKYSYPFGMKIEPVPKFLVIDLMTINYLPQFTFLFYYTNRLQLPQYLYPLAHSKKAVVFLINQTLLLTN